MGNFIYLLFCRLAYSATLNDIDILKAYKVLVMNEFYVKIVRGILVLLSKLPLKFHYFMADIFTWFIKKIMKYRMDVIWVNVARSFPDKKYDELEKIVHDFYDHLGDIVAEAIWFCGSDYKRLYDSGIVTVMEPEVISKLYDEAPSVTVLSTHCGNWELLGGFLGYRTSDGTKVNFGEEAISVVYKKLRDPIFDKVFALNRVNPLEIVGTKCEIESRNILRYAIQHRNEKRVYIYPTDQAPYQSTGKHPMGIFMNQETNAMLGSAVVANKLSHAVAYMKMKLIERGKYEMSLIPICTDASKMAPEEIMRKYYDLLEEEINETPHNWLWSHKRWK